MENILALVVVAVVIGGAIAIGRIVYKSYKRHKEEEANRLAEAKIRVEEYWKQKEFERNMRVKEVNSKPVAKPAKKTVSESYSEVTKKPTQQTSTTTTSSDDGFLTGMLVGAAIDSLLHSGKSEASVERSAGVSSKESSWGFDDSDSRKSISSSMDTSSSYSSSDFGSSDSGPSSDW
jgi:uncharacterized membrane protein YebE (DUF533 family)